MGFLLFLLREVPVPFLLLRMDLPFSSTFSTSNAVFPLLLLVLRPVVGYEPPREVTSSLEPSDTSSLKLDDDDLSLDKFFSSSYFNCSALS